MIIIFIERNLKGSMILVARKTPYITKRQKVSYYTLNITYLLFYNEIGGVTNDFRFQM